MHYPDPHSRSQPQSGGLPTGYDLLSRDLRASLEREKILRRRNGLLQGSIILCLSSNLVFVLVALYVVLQ